MASISRESWEKNLKDLIRTNISAGLLIKELFIRGDLERCLNVAPVSLEG